MAIQAPPAMTGDWTPDGPRPCSRRRQAGAFDRQLEVGDAWMTFKKLVKGD
jgi:hypothetical protein